MLCTIKAIYICLPSQYKVTHTTVAICLPCKYKVTHTVVATAVCVTLYWQGRHIPYGAKF